MDGPNCERCATGVASLVYEPCDANLAHPVLARENSRLVRNHVADRTREVHCVARNDEGGFPQLDRHELLVSAYDGEGGEDTGLEGASCERYYIIAAVRLYS